MSIYRGEGFGAFGWEAGCDHDWSDDRAEQIESIVGDTVTLHYSKCLRCGVTKPLRV